jgi:hypothetical protein
MASLPVLHTSAIRAVPKGRSVGRAAPARGATEAAAAQEADFRVALDRPVEAAAPLSGGRPRDEASAVLLFLARDETGGYETGGFETAGYGTRPAASVYTEAASLAYRQHGALPELFSEEPVVFSWRL